jgi:predicted aspartyl protease
MLSRERIKPMPISPILAKLVPLLAAFPVLTGQDALQQASTVDVVAIGTDRHDRMTVPVRIGESGPYNFLIDTGAQNTVLSKTLAARLSLVSTRKARLVGIAGSEIVDTVDIDEIGLGRRSYYSLLAPLLDQVHIGADGIVGLDTLQGQRVLLDFKRRLITIDDAKNLGGNRGFEIVVTAKRRSGQLIMADAVIDGVRTDVVIDTGAETSIGNPALQRAMSRRHGEGTSMLTSVTGQEIEAQMGIGRKLAIGNMAINNLLIAYADAPAFAALDLDKRPAILLGMRDLRTFDRVAIDFATRKVLFDLPREAF